MGSVVGRSSSTTFLKKRFILDEDDGEAAETSEVGERVDVSDRSESLERRRDETTDLGFAAVELRM